MWLELKLVREVYLCGIYIYTRTIHEIMRVTSERGTREYYKEIADYKKQFYPAYWVDKIIPVPDDELR